MKLLALEAIYKIACRIHPKIYARSTEYNTDHVPWAKLRTDMAPFAKHIEVVHGPPVFKNS